MNILVHVHLMNQTGCSKLKDNKTIPAAGGQTGRKKEIMARGKALTYEEFIALAKENYNKGGDVIVECWERYQFDDYVKMFGAITKTKAMRMFREYKSQEQEENAMMFGW